MTSCSGWWSFPDAAANAECAHLANLLIENPHYDGLPLCGKPTRKDIKGFVLAKVIRWSTRLQETILVSVCN